jgi:hypothetical protein
VRGDVYSSIKDLVMNTSYTSIISGTTGDSRSIYVDNSNCVSSGDSQVGAYFLISGVDTSLPLPFGPGISSTKTGIQIAVSGAARTNTGIAIDVQDGVRNYSIITNNGFAQFNANNDDSSGFMIQGGSFSFETLFSADPYKDSVTIGSYPSFLNIRKFNVNGNYSFMHDPTASGAKQNHGLSASLVEGYGDIVTFGSGSLTAGLLYFLDTTGAWDLTDAGGTAKSTSLLAIALGGSPSDGMLIKGYVINSSWSGFGIGVPLFIAVAASPSLLGTIDAAAPTSPGEVVRIIGHSINTNSDGVIHFNPSNDWIEL